MNIAELYKKTPVKRHSEIVVSGGRLFFGGEEYVIEGDGNLRLVHSHKAIEASLDKIKIKLGV